MLPDFFIIGAQKAGTTFLHLCLGEHPDVFMPTSELAFFEDPDYSQTDIQSFERLFEKGQGKKAVGMKRPTYLHRPECAARIHSHRPSAKLIAILRDPAERAISAYCHYARLGFAPIRDVNRGLPEIIDGKHAGRHPRAAEIIEFGFYHEHLERYLDYFDRQQVLIALYDDLLKSPLDLLTEVFRFLGIDEQYVPESLDSRPQASLYSVTRLKLLAVRNPILYTYTGDRMRLFPKEQVGLLGSLVVKVINVLDRRLLSRLFGNKKPNLSQEVIGALSDIYSEDCSRLEELLGRSLAHWRVLEAG